VAETSYDTSRIQLHNQSLGSISMILGDARQPRSPLLNIEPADQI